MTIDISTTEKGYLNSQELALRRQYVESIGFEERKYNQLGHLWSVLSHLDDLVVHDNYVYLQEDAEKLELDKESKTVGRDQYLQRIYKNQLYEETKGYGFGQCMVERLAYPSLVASHIKPYIVSEEDEMFDVNNGLLISRNMDLLFNYGYISFDDEGGIMVSARLTHDLKDHLKSYSLNTVYLNEERIKYLHYHQEEVFS
jgi:putative restriction endonuclease